MKGRIQFYHDLKSNFSEIAELALWNSVDYENDPFDSAEILTSIAVEIVQWFRTEELERIKKLTAFLEDGYNIYSEEIMSYIYTDFLPTLITEQDTEARDFIKSTFGPELRNHYNQLLKYGFYAEL